MISVCEMILIPTVRFKNMASVLTDILDRIRQTDGCQVLAPAGQPSISDRYAEIPVEVNIFYSNAGGAILFSETAFETTILKPSEITNYDPYSTPDDRFGSHPDIRFLYSIAHSSAGMVAIGCGGATSGMVHDASDSAYGIEHPIIAKSFTEYLLLLLHYRGENIPWEDRTPRHGHIYDYEKRTRRRS